MNFCVRAIWMFTHTMTDWYVDWLVRLERVKQPRNGDVLKSKETISLTMTFKFGPRICKKVWKMYSSKTLLCNILNKIKDIIKLNFFICSTEQKLLIGKMVSIRSIFYVAKKYVYHFSRQLVALIYHFNMQLLLFFTIAVASNISLLILFAISANPKALLVRNVKYTKLLLSSLNNI